MSTSDKNAIRGLACGIFSEEIKKLIDEGEITIPFSFYDSNLHMTPRILGDKLKAELDDREEKTVLVFGQCFPDVRELENQSNVCRTCGINCAELLIGSQEFRKLRKEGAFFLLPEWVIRWEEFFRNIMGFDEKTASQFMREMHSKLIFLHTGIGEIPVEKLESISLFTGLPYEIREVTLDHLSSAIKKAISLWEESAADERTK